MKTKTKPIINGVRFLKHGVRDANGAYFPVFYSIGQLFITPGQPELRLAVKIYARSYGKLPAALSPQNNSDMMTDYFEADAIKYWEGTPEFELLKSLC